MKIIKKILVMLIALGLCGTLAACGASKAGAEDSPAKTEPAAQDSKEEEKPEKEAEPEENETDSKVNVGIIGWSLGMAEEASFAEAVHTKLTEQYPDQIGEVLIMDSQKTLALLFEHLHNCRSRWYGTASVIVLVNDEKGFSDADLLNFFGDAELTKLPVGVDHVIDGAPDFAFVYDKADAAGCASLIMEKAGR
ncbi:MAG: hypothetical protein K6A40_11285 [Solobacterium sp.]|nr:hypothetical protein [Solobacterium sp.]